MGTGALSPAQLLTGNGTSLGIGSSATTDMMGTMIPTHSINGRATYLSASELLGN